MPATHPLFPGFGRPHIKGFGLSNHRECLTDLGSTISLGPNAEEALELIKPPRLSVNEAWAARRGIPKAPTMVLDKMAGGN